MPGSFAREANSGPRGWCRVGSRVCPRGGRWRGEMTEGEVGGLVTVGLEVDGVITNSEIVRKGDGPHEQQSGTCSS